MLYRNKSTLTRENFGSALQWRAVSLKDSSKLLQAYLKSSGRADEQRFPSAVSRAKNPQWKYYKIILKRDFLFI